MKILFVRGSSPLSWVICKLTKEDVSHCAVEIDEWVLHSNFYGVHWDSKIEFQDKCTVLHQLEVPNNYERVVDLSAHYSGHRNYDFGGLLYLGVRLLLRVIGIHLPKKNLWQMTGMFLCTEWVTEVLGDTEDSEITPFKLWEKLNAATATGVTPDSVRS